MKNRNGLTWSILALLFTIFLSSANSQELYQKSNGLKTRWITAENMIGEKGQAGKSNGGRKGSAYVTLDVGERKVIADISGSSGMVRRIWMTICDLSPKILQGLQIEIYWDNASTPAVSSPIGDFFGQALGQNKTFENALFSSPEGRSFNCFAPMPFKNAMKIVVTNTTDTNLFAFFYEIDYTLGDAFDKNTLYFHAIYNRQNPTKLKEDFEILPKIVGQGRYLGVNISINCKIDENFHSGFGEGEVKIYLDGDTEYPTLCGTGTEDYTGTGWGMGVYSHLYQGCTISDTQNEKYAFYRYHIPDPVYFDKDIRVTLQQMGWASRASVLEMERTGNKYYHLGEGWPEIDLSLKYDNFLHERRDDVACCTYFYLSAPTH